MGEEWHCSHDSGRGLRVLEAEPRRDRPHAPSARPHSGRRYQDSGGLCAWAQAVSEDGTVGALGLTRLGSGIREGRGVWASFK